MPALSWQFFFIFRHFPVSLLTGTFPFLRHSQGAQFTVTVAQDAFEIPIHGLRAARMLSLSSTQSPFLIIDERASMREIA
jgi:hypothetical protein